MREQRRRSASAPWFLLYTDSTSTIPRLKSKNLRLLAYFCACTARFASDLVGTPKCLVKSHAKSQMEISREIYVLVHVQSYNVLMLCQVVDLFIPVCCLNWDNGAIKQDFSIHQHSLVHKGSNQWSWERSPEIQSLKNNIFAKVIPTS